MARIGMTVRRRPFAPCASVVVALVVALVVAGCSSIRTQVGRDRSPGPSATEGPGVAQPPPPGPSTPAGGTGSAGTPSGGTGSAGPPSPGGTGSPGPPPAEQPGTPPGPPPAPAPAAGAILGAAHSGVGGFARTILAPGPATAVVLEVLHQEGAEVAEVAIGHATNVLSQVSSKPTTKTTVSLAGGARNWTRADLERIADDQSRSAQGAGGRAVLYLEFLHGTYQGDESVLGIALRGDVAAVFVDRVRSSATLLVSESDIEDSVLMHEIGHLLGLVDLALHSGREDPAHPGHSASRDSVMYWAVESNLITQILGGRPPRDFDADDRRDLDALRAGA